VAWLAANAVAIPILFQSITGFCAAPESLADLQWSLYCHDAAKSDRVLKEPDRADLFSSLGAFMKLLCRTMQPGDIRKCVDILANHPIIGPRYGSAIEHLPEAWFRLLQYEAQEAVVVRTGEGSNAPICLAGVSARILYPEGFQ
jgi:hypothetical protein